MIAQQTKYATQHLRRHQPALPMQRPLPIRAVPSRPGPSFKSGCACGGGCPSCQSQSGLDPAEREAEAVAARVMRMPDPTPAAPAAGPRTLQQPTGPRTQHQPEADTEPDDTLQRQEEAEQALPQPAAQLAAAVADAIPPERPAYDAAMHDAQPLAGLGDGEALSPALRAFFEPRFGRNFAQVRIHHSAAAQRRARDFNAQAFTFGRDIVFGAGYYRPDADTGRHLLAHELTHVVQQGRARGRSRAVIQRFVNCEGPENCPPREAGEISRSRSTPMELFELTSGGSGMLLANFAVDGSNIRGDLTTNAAWNRFVTRMASDTDTSWRILGFTDCHGGEQVNDNLRAFRALELYFSLPPAARAQVHSYAGADLTDCVRPNDSEANRRLNRSALILLFSRSITLDEETIEGEVPEQEPEETTPEQTTDGCGSFEDFVAAALNANPNLIADLLDCFCEGVKFLDIAESALQYVPGVGSVVERFESLIERIDFLCNLWDGLQLIYDVGTDETPCWDASTIDAGEVARIIAYFASVAADLFADELGRLIVDRIASFIEGAAAGSGAAGGSAGGPVGSGAGALLGIILAEAVKAKIAEAIDLMIDLSLYFIQNELTHGTPFPLDPCRSCMRLPRYFGGRDRSGLCDQWNEALVPEAIRFPSIHGSSTGDETAQ